MPGMILGRCLTTCTLGRREKPPLLLFVFTDESLSPPPLFPLLQASYAVGPSADPGTFRPAKLNTSQWADVMVGLGAKGAILTAKHGCGHLLWPSKTTLPNGTTYPYSVGRERSFIKGDVLAQFTASMSARGIGHGFYYSLTNNFFLNVISHQAGASKTLLPGQVNVSQAEFEAIALAQVTELWTEYGNLTEIW